MVHTLKRPFSKWITTAEALRYGTCSQGFSQFYLHTHTFIRNRNEPHLPFSNMLSYSSAEKRSLIFGHLNPCNNNWSENLYHGNEGVVVRCQGRLLHINNGANAPWKNKVEAFCRNLGGSASIIKKASNMTVIIWCFISWKAPEDRCY